MNEKIKEEKKDIEEVIIDTDIEIEDLKKEILDTCEYPETD